MLTNTEFRDTVSEFMANNYPNGTPWTSDGYNLVFDRCMVNNKSMEWLKAALNETLATIKAYGKNLPQPSEFIEVGKRIEDTKCKASRNRKYCYVPGCDDGLVTLNAFQVPGKIQGEWVIRAVHNYKQPEKRFPTKYNPPQWYKDIVGKQEKPVYVKKSDGFMHISTPIGSCAARGRIVGVVARCLCGRNSNKMFSDASGLLDREEVIYWRSYRGAVV